MTLYQLYVTWLYIGCGILVYDIFDWLCCKFADNQAEWRMNRLDCVVDQFNKNYADHFVKRGRKV